MDHGSRRAGAVGAGAGARADDGDADARRLFKTVQLAISACVFGERYRREIADAIARVRLLRDKLLHFTKAQEIFAEVKGDGLYERTRFDDLDLVELIDEMAGMVDEFRADERPMTRIILNHAASIFDEAIVVETRTFGEESSGKMLYPSPARCETAIRMLHWHAQACRTNYVEPIERAEARQRAAKARAGRGSSGAKWSAAREVLLELVEKHKWPARIVARMAILSGYEAPTRRGRDPDATGNDPVEQLIANLRVELTRRRKTSDR